MDQLSIHLSISCTLGDIRLWVGDPSKSSCPVSLPRGTQGILAGIRLTAWLPPGRAKSISKIATPQQDSAGGQSFIQEDEADPHSMACEDPRPHAWNTCAACFCPCIFVSRATPLRRSRCQTWEFPTELSTHIAPCRSRARKASGRLLPPGRRRTQVVE